MIVVDGDTVDSDSVVTELAASPVEDESIP